MHRFAEVGFGRASAAYERGRPDYPLAAVDHVFEKLELGKAAAVLDLAAGTGKMTRLLEGRGGRVVAVEPVEAMRDELVRRAPFAEALAGTAEHVPLSDASMDAVIVAQAFHWFDGPRALAEIHRVLVANGGLALIWNARDQSVPWVAELTELIDRHAADAPRHRSNAWRVAFEETVLFTAIETSTFSYRQPIPSLDALVDRVSSISFVASLDDDRRAALLDEVRAFGAAHQVTTFPYRTEVHTCRRVG